MSYQSMQMMAFHHYFQTKPFRCTHLSGDFDGIFTAKLKETVDIGNNIIKGDPILFGMMTPDQEVIINGGHVITCAEGDQKMIISPDKLCTAPEKRQHERFPVSLYGHIKRGRSMEPSFPVFIKDMSYSGLRLYTSIDLPVDENVEIDICFYNNVLNLDGIIARKAVSYGRNEYGIQLIYRNKYSIYATKEYLDNILTFEKQIIHKHLFI